MIVPRGLRIALIWAMARNRVIGYRNTLPWKLPADLAHFKSLTTGHAVIMGRHTYDSLGRPLPQRTNIVITRDPDFRCEGCHIARSLDHALQMALDLHPRNPDPVFVIGGQNLYSQMLPMADILYITQIEADVAGDAWFPEYAESAWELVSREGHEPDERNPYPYTFLTLQRKTPRSD